MTGSSRESENAVPGYPRPTALRRRASNSHVTGFHQGSDLGADSIDASAPLGCRAKAAAACQHPGAPIAVTGARTHSSWAVFTASLRPRTANNGLPPQCG